MTQEDWKIVHSCSQRPSHHPLVLLVWEALMSLWYLDVHIAFFLSPSPAVFSLQTISEQLEDGVELRAMMTKHILGYCQHMHLPHPGTC